MRAWRGGGGCAAAVAECLERVASEGRVANAFISACGAGGRDEAHEAAMTAATEADARWELGTQKGPLDGMPVAVKDNFCMDADLPGAWPTTAASRMLEGFRAPYSAAAVERLQAAGAVVVGKTNMDEFGMGSFGVNSHFGPTSLERDGRRQVCGGSSSGSAAAVALGCAVAALGSDTGGSVRLPAAYCGVVGLKPTYGRISRFGLIAYASSLDTPGILARDTESAASVLSVLAGPDVRDATCIAEEWEAWDPEAQSDPRPLRVGIPAEFAVEEMPEEAVRAWQAAAESLRDLHGAEIVPVSVPSVVDALPAYYVIACSEASSNLARYDGVQYGHRASGTSEDLAAEYTRTRSEGFGQEVQRRLLMGTFALSEAAFEDYYVRATAVRARLRREFASVFASGVDVLLTPVSPFAPPTLEEAARTDPVQGYLTDVLTVPASLAGLPAGVVPGPGGASAQLMAAHGREDVLLRAMRALEVI